MPDVVDQATRRRMMAGIRGANTAPELRVRRLLHAQGFRFRLNVRDLPGKPDIVLPRYRAVIFVNGCFWHGHDCALFKWPSTRAEWWRAKIQKTQETDRNARANLTDKGWRVAIVWECAMKGSDRLLDVDLVALLVDWLRDPERPDLVVSGRRR
jgi:DNA mismatch endonuclease (patch repair protein)